MYVSNVQYARGTRVNIQAQEPPNPTDLLCTFQPLHRRNNIAPTYHRHRGGGGRHRSGGVRKARGKVRLPPHSTAAARPTPREGRSPTALHSRDIATFVHALLASTIFHREDSDHDPANLMFGVCACHTPG